MCLVYDKLSIDGINKQRSHTMEYNLKEVLKDLFINLVVTFVVAFIFDYFNINSDRHGWFLTL